MDWFLERARELGVEHAPPEPLVKGRHLIALGVTPGPALGEVLRAGLRAPARWHGPDFDDGFALARELSSRSAQCGATEAHDAE